MKEEGAMKEDEGIGMEGVEGEGSGSGSGLITQSETEGGLVKGQGTEKEERVTSPVLLSPRVRIKAEERDEEMAVPSRLPAPPSLRTSPLAWVKTEKAEEARRPATIFLSDGDEDDEL